MGILSKILAALFGGIILFQLYATVMNAPVINLIWTVILCLPLTLALLGRGGRAVYVVALLYCWCLAGMMLVAMPLEIYLDYFTDYLADDHENLSVSDGLIISTIGLIGVAGHICITRLHPVASRNILARKLNELYLDTMRRQAMAFAGNIVLSVLVLEAGWMFTEVAIVYWYESVLITLFAIWTVKHQPVFDTRHKVFEGVTTAQAKHAFYSQHLGPYFFFYAIYLGVILGVGGLPTASEFGGIAFIALAWFLASYIDATEQHRALRNKPLDLTIIESQHAWRIVPIHLGCMLGMLAIGDDDPGLALLFILVKMTFEIIQEASDYSTRRKQAVHNRRRRPAPLDLGGIATSMPDPLISIGDRAK